MRQAVLMMIIGLAAFGSGAYFVQKLYEPIVLENRQSLHECSYQRDACIHEQSEDDALRNSCKIALEDARGMLGTCKQVLSFADSRACPPPPAPVPAKTQKKWRPRKRRR